MKSNFWSSDFNLAILLFNCLFWQACADRKPAGLLLEREKPLDSVSIYSRLPILKSLDSLERLSMHDLSLDLLLKITLPENSHDSMYLQQRIHYSKKKLTDISGKEKLLIKETEPVGCEALFWSSYFEYKSYSQSGKLVIATSALNTCLHDIQRCFQGYNIPYKNLLLEYADFCQYSTENYPKADTLYTMAQEYYEKHRDTDSNYLIQVLTGHTNIKRHAAEYEVAQYYLNKAASLMKDPLQNKIFPKLLNDLAIMKFSQGFNDEITPLVDSAYTLAFGLKDTLQFARSMFIKGVYYNFVKEYQKADSLYLKISEYPHQYYSKGEIGMRLLQNAISKQDVKLSKKYMAQVNLGMRSFGPERMAYFKTIESNYHKLNKNYPLAIKSINEAIRFSEPLLIIANNSISPPPNRINEIKDMSLHYLGLRCRLLSELYHFTENRIYRENAEKNYLYIDSLFSENCLFTDDANEFHAMDIMNDVYMQGMKLFYDKYQESNEQKYLEYITTLSERLRSKVLYRNINKQALANTIKDTSVQRLINEEIEISKLLNLAKGEPKNLKVDILIQKRQTVLDSLKSKSLNDYNRLYGPQSLSIEKIKKWCKDENFNIITFNQDSENNTLIISYSDTVEVKMYNKLDTIFENLNQDRFSNSNAKYVYDKIFKEFHFKYDNYILYPTGQMSKIPLHTIFAKMDPKDSNYSKNLVFYSFSLKKLIGKDLKLEEMRKFNSLASFSLADKGDMELPYTYLESKYLESIKIKHTEVYRGNKFTKENLLKALNSTELIHIATHGRFSSSSNVFSSIKLYDNFISVKEITSLDLKFIPKYIILTVCNGNTGNYIVGEGQESLIRAFACLDIPVIISTNTIVNDKSAFRIFEKLFNTKPNIELKLSSNNMLFYIY